MQGASLDSQRKSGLTPRRLLQIVLIAVGWAFAILTVQFFILVPMDWHYIFRPATIVFWTGGNPFELDGYFNAPWLLLLTWPLAVLPPDVGAALFGIARLLGLTFVAWKLGANRLTLVLFALSPHLIGSFYNSNSDFIAALGFIMPPWLGLIFVAIKPQIGVGFAAFWLVESYRRGGWRETVKTFAPVMVLTLVSFAIYGLWPLKGGALVEVWWNISWWPYSLLVGVPLVVTAIRRREPGLSIAASPLFSPYTGVSSIPVAVLGLLPRQAETIGVIGVMWLLRLFLTGRG